MYERCRHVENKTSLSSNYITIRTRIITIFE